jgi:predicted dehydrogenase
VAAVGYHLRALEQLPAVKARLARDPAILVTATWQDGTPAPAWWLRAAVGGGQVVEQATHLYDLARLLVGEAEVVGATSALREPVTPPRDVVDATAAWRPARLARSPTRAASRRTPWRSRLQGMVLNHDPTHEPAARDLEVVVRTAHQSSRRRHATHTNARQAFLDAVGPATDPRAVVIRRRAPGGSAHAGRGRATGRAG